MIAAQRRNIILDTLRAEGAVSITALAESLGTSAVTVRRDLDQLAEAGLLTRTHGGAVLHTGSRESSYTEKLEQALAEKAWIATRAAELVSDGDVVAIGPGSTTELLAQRLTSRVGLRVVTNSLLVAAAFVESPENEVIVTGGVLRPSIRAVVGGASVQMLGSVRADTAFLSGNGLAADFGLSTPASTVADSDRAMAAAAARVVALVDYTKVGLRSAVQTVPTARLERVITDVAASVAELRALAAAGVVVESVDSSGERSTIHS